MACSCKKRNEESLNFEKAEIEPFETCLYCCYKHLSYALVLIETTNELARALGQIYLAFKHVEKAYLDSIGRNIFEILKVFFQEKNIDIKMIKICLNQAQTLIDKDIDIEEIPISNYEEKNFKSNELCILYLSAALELYFNEPGYEEINKPYVFGLLQKAAENTIPIERLKIRNFWKQIEMQNYSDIELYNYINSLLKINN